MRSSGASAPSSSSGTAPVWSGAAHTVQASSCPARATDCRRDGGFTSSLSNVAALWCGTPVTARLDDPDKICAALESTVADLLKAQPVTAAVSPEEQDPATISASGPTGSSRATICNTRVTS
ncbi:helix-turn-helix domain-containing protein [Streptomyces olivochromogenes]|nr:helix-turn-helix domain-containing protein [Streptomyces olivochromogenes]